MRDLVAYALAQPEPLVLLGDLNATEQNIAYRIVAGPLGDAWLSGGWGMGHTFPGDTTSGSNRRRLGDVRIPMWLLRLDYIFYSEEWQVEDAWIGPWSGVSDHRPVVARLALGP